MTAPLALRLDALAAWKEIETATNAAQEMRRSKEVRDWSLEVVMIAVRKHLDLFRQCLPLALEIARTEEPSVFRISVTFALSFT